MKLKWGVLIRNGPSFELVAVFRHFEQARNWADQEYGCSAIIEEIEY